MRLVIGDDEKGQELLDRPDVLIASPAEVKSRGASLYEVDPISDPRWSELVARHPHASFYHSQAWLEALKRTYGWTPVAYTTSPRGHDLSNGLVFCRVESWLTGRRMVSLPFSDHCDPLFDGEGALAGLMGRLVGKFQKEGWRYTELRPRRTFPDAPQWLVPDKQYCFHSLDLSPRIAALHSSMHKDCIRRKIKRAEKEGLEYREGSSPELLKIFYRLFTKTRRKHGLPPQPFMWFLNLSQILGPSLQVRVAMHAGRPVASIITVIHRQTIIYKYGCSDPELAKFGGTPWLFWRIIIEAKSWGLRELDLGRSDFENPGLIAFKDRLGAQRTPVTYLRFPKPQGVADGLTSGKWQSIAGKIFRHTPSPLLAAAGRLLYPHMG